MAANQTRFPVTLGWQQFNTTWTTSNLALNASGEYLAYSFMPDTNKTINSVRVYMVAMAGTLAANDLGCRIYSDSSGAPGSAVTGGSLQPANAVPSAGWVQFDSFTASLTAGTQYWIVLSNPATTSGSASSVYPTYQWINNVLARTTLPIGSTQSYGWAKYQSANSGSTWTSQTTGIVGFSILYSDGTYDGLPISTVNTLTASKVYNNGSSSIEYGIKFTSPANAAVNVRTVVVNAGNTSAVGPLLVKLYTGSSASGCVLAGKTETIAASIVVAGVGVLLHFSSAIVIPPSTVCRLVIADNSGSGSSSAYFFPYGSTFDSAIAGLASLLPFDGTMVETTTPNGTSTIGNSPGTMFTDSGFGTVMPWALLLDTNGEFTSTAGGLIPGVVSSHPHPSLFQ